MATTETQATHRVLKDGEKFRLWNFLNSRRDDIHGKMTRVDAAAEATKACGFEVTECNVRKACKVSGIKLASAARKSGGRADRASRRRVEQAMIVHVLRNLLYDLGQMDLLADLNRVFPAAAEDTNA